MNTVNKKIKELEERFKFEVMTQMLRSTIKHELNLFIIDTFPNIKNMDTYFKPEYEVNIGSSTLELNFKDEFSKELFEHYPEEFI